MPYLTGMQPFYTPCIQPGKGSQICCENYESTDPEGGALPIGYGEAPEMLVGERKLWTRVLLAALRDAVDGKEDALDWLADTANAEPGACTWVLEVLDLPGIIVVNLSTIPRCATRGLGGLKTNW